MPLRLAYSPRYDITAFGLEKLHPFDSRKYGRAMGELRRTLGAKRLHAMRVRVPRAIDERELLRVHTAEHLAQLRDPAYVARVLEVPQAARLPGWMVDWRVLRPMRWATMGTLVAAREALVHGLAVNVGGGYHHAKPAQGEGFCAYADVAVAVAALREEGVLREDDAFVHVDLDAHQGNGVATCFMEDRRALLFDVFNGTIYPAEAAAQRRVDRAVPLRFGATGDEYLAKLRDELPRFLDGVTRGGRVKLAFYNAGTDVFDGDPLGGLRVSAEDVLARDLFTIGELRERGLPTVMLTSGGYTRESYRLIAATIAALAS